MAKRRVHVVAYTHWDREFRWEFERTRMRLVDCLDVLLDILEDNPEYRHFMLDGQMTLVDDYLEIRPENADRIGRLIREGRLEAGPWFTLPDCAPVNGECVVRNLAYGIERARAFGNVMTYGYNVFSFGQIAQLPQIYANFGIDTIIFYKSMDPARTKYHEFIWEGPDGTRALASRLGKEARWNFFFAGHVPIVYDMDPWHKDWQYTWGDLGKVFHTADPEGYGWFYDIADPETAFHPENIREGMDRALKTVEGTAMPESVLLFEGTDFTEPHPLTPEILKEIQKQYGDELEVVHSTLGAYLDELKEALSGRDDLDVVSGPMRDGPVGAVHSDVMSIHPEMQIENGHAENTLLRWAEPLSTVAWAHGIERYPDTYLDKIWRLLFQSHAHDSLHGLGPVTLAEGELARLKQAKVIAQGLERRALQNITKEIDTSAVADSDYFVVVHNPSSFARSEVVEAYVDVPASVQLEYIILEDMDGNTAPIQEVDRSDTRAGVYHPRSRNMPFYCTKVHVFFLADDVPAMGYKTYKLKWAEKNEYPYPHEDWDAPRILAESMATGPCKAENNCIGVTVNADGTLDVTDKASSRTYAGLNYLQDQGETGNMWMSNSPGRDRVRTSLGTPARVAMAVQGPLAVVFEIETAMSLPSRLDVAQQERSKDETELPTSVRVTLRKNSPYLEIVTTIDNTVRDHYLKVCFPTHLDADKTWADGAFSVTEYAVRPSTDGDLRGKELARHPAQLWFDVADDTEGLAVLSDAAKDYEILENEDAMTMAMGLVRGVPLRIPCDNRLWMEYPGDESPQSLRSFTYRYAIQPHAGRWDEAGLHETALAFNTPLRACQFGKQEGCLPTTNSFLELDGKNLVLSAVKKARDRDSVLVRLFNPTGQTVEATLTAGFDFSEAHLVNLAEERTSPLDARGRSVSFTVGKGKIVGIELAV